jgi:hypothetical protein
MPRLQTGPKRGYYKPQYPASPLYPASFAPAFGVLTPGEQPPAFPTPARCCTLVALMQHGGGFTPLGVMPESSGDEPKRKLWQLLTSYTVYDILPESAKVSSFGRMLRVPPLTATLFNPALPPVAPHVGILPPPLALVVGT